MLLAAILILFLLALINYRIGGRALLHPAVVYSLVWALDLFLIWLVGDFFYPLSPQTILIFVGGPIFFAIGSGIASLFSSRNETPNSQNTGIGDFGQKLLTRIVAFEILSLPLAIRWMMYQVAEHPGINFIVSMSRAVTDDSVKGTLGYSLFGNLVIVSNVIALVSFYERGKHSPWWRTICAIAIAIGLDVAIAARSSFVPLFFSILCLDWLKTRRIKWKALAASFVVLLVLALAIAVALGKVGTDPSASLIENAGPGVQGLVTYAAGGPVAFDQMRRDPAIERRAFPLGPIFAQILIRFGAHVTAEDGESGPGFLELGPHHLPTNVYSIYGEYLETGYAAMMGLMVFLGTVITLFYKRALRGLKISVILYASFFSGLLLSPFFDLFLSSIYHYAKTGSLIWIVYHFPRVWTSKAPILSGQIKSDLIARNSGSSL